MHDPRKLADRHQGKYLGHILIPSYCSSKLRQNELAWLDIYSDIQFTNLKSKSSFISPLLINHLDGVDMKNLNNIS